MITAAGPLTIEWLNQLKNKNRKTLKISEIDYFIQLLDDFYIQNGTAEDPYFYDDLKRAIKYEISENKYDIDYYAAYSNYKDVYESIKDNLSCYKLSQAKKMFETKMSEMLYIHLRDSYKSKKYDDFTAIYTAREFINDEYMTENYKIECKIILVNALYKEGENNLKSEYYESACEKFEEALNIINSNWKVKNKFFYSDNLIRYLVNAYEKLAIKNWQLNMKKSIEYLDKVRNINNNKTSLIDLYIYYYLFNAYHNNDDSSRTNYLYQAQKFVEGSNYCLCRLPENRYFLCYFRNYIHNDITDLYEKQNKIIELKNKINMKNSEVSNLNHEFYSIKNDISNIESLINPKKKLIKSKNEEITALNKLVDSLILQEKEVNNKTENVIKEEENKVNEIKKNVSANKDFIKEIKELEKQKKEEIQNFKNSNKNLEEKNKQLILMLSSLENNL